MHCCLCCFRFIPRSIFGPFWLREQYILHFRLLLNVNTLCVRVRVCVCVCWTQESEGSALVEILRWHSAESICAGVWVSTDRLAPSLSDDRRLARRQHSILKLSFNPEQFFFLHWNLKQILRLWFVTLRFWLFVCHLYSQSMSVYVRW